MLGSAAFLQRSGGPKELKKENYREFFMADTAGSPVDENDGDRPMTTTGRVVASEFWVHKTVLGSLHSIHRYKQLWLLFWRAFWKGRQESSPL